MESLDKSSPAKDGIFSLHEIPISNISMEDALKLVMSKVQDNSLHHEIHFVNAHCINTANRDGEYRKILQSSSAIFPDGSGIRLAGKILKQPIQDNVNGTDLFPVLCKELAKQKKRVFLLGAKPGTTARVYRWIVQHAGNMTIAGYHHGYFDEKHWARVIQAINDSRADILLVAMGVPKQEKWIRKNLVYTQVSVAMGVGGLFDFYSGNISRAPKLLRKMGMEWIWRLLMEPRRMWRRYILGNFIFLFEVVKEKSRLRHQHKSK